MGFLEAGSGVRASVQAHLAEVPQITLTPMIRCGGLEKDSFGQQTLCFLLLCQSGYFPTSSGTNLIAVGANTWLMCLIMQGSTCHLQLKQAPRHSS